LGLHLIHPPIPTFFAAILTNMVNPTFVITRQKDEQLAALDAVYGQQQCALPWKELRGNAGARRKHL